MILTKAAFALTLALGILLAPLAAEAQQPGKVPQIGVLGGRPQLVEAFKQGLRELGYVEGQNIAFEYRWAEGKVERLPTLAAELVRLKVDLIFAPSTPTALAARDATSTIPIVFAVVADPVGAGLVASLARPGGNLTGLTTINVELWPKRLELLKETVPKTSRVAFFYNPADASNVLALKQIEGPARLLGVTVYPRGVRGPNEFEGAFSAMASDRTHALAVSAGILTATHAKRIVDLAARARIPAIYGSREFVEAGGLMSYAASFRDNHRRAATYVDKILKGAKPADIPVEQPTRFELVINLKTAKALGLTFPQSVLIQADKVIE